MPALHPHGSHVVPQLLLRRKSRRSHDDAPSAELPAANASNVSPRAKMVFLLAVMFVSCLGLRPQKRANR